MSNTDRRPLQNTPVTARITSRANNRLGAVYSALHAFWTARHAAVVQPGQTVNAARRDTYSIVLFDARANTVIQNDFVSTPEALLDLVLLSRPGRGTNFTVALQTAQSIMERNWSTERSPVVIFLSDGEGRVADTFIQDFSLRALALGRGLSFHAVAFGPYNAALRRMVQVAADIQSGAPADPLHPAVPSSYTEALDAIRLAETFLGIAESLRKPRGSLMRA